MCTPVPPSITWGDDRHANGRPLLSAVGRNASFSALTFSQKYFCRSVVAPFGDGLGCGTNSIVEKGSISNLAGLVVAGVRKRLTYKTTP